MVIYLSEREEDAVIHAAEAGLKYVCHCFDCQVHHSYCWIWAEAEKVKPLQPVVNEVCSALGNSNRYVGRRGTKPQESIDYLFDMLLKPGGQVNGGDKDGGEKSRQTDQWVETALRHDHSHDCECSGHTGDTREAIRWSSLQERPPNVWLKYSPWTETTTKLARVLFIVSTEGAGQWNKEI